MSALTLLQSILHEVGPPQIIVLCTDSEVYIKSTTNIEVHISIPASSLPNPYRGSFSIKTTSFYKILRHCKCFSEVKILSDEGKIRIDTEKSLCTLSFECSIFPVEYKGIPKHTPSFLTDINPLSIQSLVVYEAETVEISVNRSNICIVSLGSIHSKISQNVYFRKQIKDTSTFIVSAAFFKHISALCLFTPEKVVLSLGGSICMFHMHYKYASVIVFSHCTEINE